MLSLWHSLPAGLMARLRYTLLSHRRKMATHYSRLTDLSLARLHNEGEPRAVLGKDAWVEPAAKKIPRWQLPFAWHSLCAERRRKTSKVCPLLPRTDAAARVPLGVGVLSAELRCVTAHGEPSPRAADPGTRARRPSPPWACHHAPARSQGSRRARPLGCHHAPGSWNSSQSKSWSQFSSYSCSEGNNCGLCDTRQHAQSGQRSVCQTFLPQFLMATVVYRTARGSAFVMCLR